jgi:4-amino-4-deoxy-L-arabinose transferase-like glycosyltransferase
MLGVGVVMFDSTANGRLRRSEALLVPLLVVGVAGSGIGGFVAHVFIADQVAESIGWPAGNPFQAEVGVANLAIGILGAAAARRRGGFREATVIAVTVFAVGASVVHVVDIVDTGNLAPGNTAQIAANLLRPILLITLIIASKRATATDHNDDTAFDLWREPVIRASAVAVVVVSSAFAIGFAIGHIVVISAIGASVAALAFAGVVRSSRRHAPSRNSRG